VFPHDPWVIRRARRDEWRVVADVWFAARFAAIPRIPAPVHDVESIGHYVARDMSAPEKEVWVADETGQVVAMLVLNGDWIEQLYVAPGRTGQGIGTALMAVAKTGRPYLQLWTFQSNSGARRFYERHGFTAQEMTDGTNEESSPDARYEWRRPGT
jgi:GNAT superfamily N-acetyltransferase